MQTEMDQSAVTNKDPPSHAAASSSTTVSTAGRLKYADPRSLPSFPSAGLSSGGAAASAAASLGWSSQKPVESWKPDKTSLASSAAAALAQDYKMSSSSQGPAPNHNGAGAKAALLAVGSAGAALKKSSPNKTSQETWGNSAAMQAFQASRPITAEPANLSHGSSAATQAFNSNRSQSVRQSETSPILQGQRSLAAAKGAMASSKQPATHSPSLNAQHKDLRGIDASAASSSALNGAALAHRASMHAKSSISTAGAVPVTTMTRNMFTSNPPVKPEVDEKAYNERLHQSAVEMAKKMYQQQQQHKQDADQDARDGEPNATQPSPYLNLQDAAYRQAQERLAKLHDEHHQNREYQEYYGKEKPPRRRFTVTSKLRRRSTGDSDIDDENHSERIRQEMSVFTSQLSQVDKQKREKDREALLAAAQRNVKARLQGMDQKVHHHTGKTDPTMLSEWEIKAQQAAQSLHHSRTENKGKVDIGGGRFMYADEVDAIAARRVQPLLDDINEKAEAERERIAVLRMEEETKKAEIERQKARDRELRELNKRVKDDDKLQERARKLQEKQDEKNRKEEEKMTKTEKKRQAKEEKRLSKVEAPEAIVSQDGGLGGNEPQGSSGSTNASSMSTNVVDTEPTEANTTRHAAKESTSPKSKVKGWIKNRFSRGKSVGEYNDNRKSFLGGATFKEKSGNESTTNLAHRPTSMRDVALAGKDGEERPIAGLEDAREAGSIKQSSPMDGPMANDSRGVSPVSTLEATNERHSRRSLSIEAPKAEELDAPRLSSSPNRDSRFHELMDR